MVPCPLSTKIHRGSPRLGVIHCPCCPDWGAPLLPGLPVSALREPGFPQDLNSVRSRCLCIARVHAISTIRAPRPPAISQ